MILSRNYVLLTTGVVDIVDNKWKISTLREYRRKLRAKHDVAADYSKVASKGRAAEGRRGGWRMRVSRSEEEANVLSSDLRKLFEY